jgi:hypothetical protein
MRPNEDAFISDGKPAWLSPSAVPGDTNIVGATGSPVTVNVTAPATIRWNAASGLTSVVIPSGSVFTFELGPDGVWYVIGSGGSGAAIIRRFTITFATPNLAAGVPLFTPVPGDVLVDAWFQVTTAWNGTTPFGDMLIQGNTGFLQQAGVLDPGSINYKQVMSSVQALSPLGVYYDNSVPNSLALCAVASDRQLAPAIFASTAPFCVVVSQTGIVGGAATGSTTGSADIYVKTATPR